MNVRKDSTNPSNITKRLLSITEATMYLGIGRNTALKYLEQIGAKRQIGRRVLYDKQLIDEYLNANIKEES